MRTKSDYFKLALWFFPATVVTWGLHEFGHYATGLLLGYDMFITFNHAGPTQGSYTSTNHDILVGMAGPIITWVQALIAWRMIMKRDQIELYAFLFLPFAMRTMAMGLSYIAKPNDEASASLLLGLPMWLLPVISVAFLLTLTISGSKKLGVGWKGNLLAYVMSSICTTIVIFLDQLIFS